PDVLYLQLKQVLIGEHFPPALKLPARRVFNNHRAQSFLCRQDRQGAHTATFSALLARSTVVLTTSFRSGCRVKLKSMEATPLLTPYFAFASAGFSRLIGGTSPSRVPKA